MGKKNPIVSFLCGVLGRKKTPPGTADDAPKREDTSDSSTSGGGDPTQAPKEAYTCAGSPEDRPRDIASQATASDQQLPLPPPPGRLHTRAASCQHQHQRSNSITSKLASSMSMRLPGSGGAGRQLSRREGKAGKLEHEDSIWKKTIILGEKCRVPDEDDDSILYDENGNRISTYHQKTHSGVLSFPRLDICNDHHERQRIWYD